MHWSNLRDPEVNARFNGMHAIAAKALETTTKAIPNIPEFLPIVDVLSAAMSNVVTGGGDHSGGARTAQPRRRRASSGAAAAERRVTLRAGDATGSALRDDGARGSAARSVAPRSTA